MPALKSPGLILRKTPYSESSFILKAFTRESGLITFIAKGAKRPKSKFRGLIDSFNLLQFVYPEKTRSDMVTLTDAHFLEDFPRLKTDLVKQAAGHVLLEIFLRYLHGQERSLPLYRMLLQGLRNLDAGQGEEVWPGLARFVLEFSGVSGYSPQFSACHVCGGGLSAISTAFDVDQGGALCRDCRGANPRAHTELSGEVVQWLDSLQGGSTRETHSSAPSSSAMRQGFAFLMTYLGRHGGGEKRIKSLEFLEQVRAE